MACRRSWTGSGVFAAASLASVVATCLLLSWTQKKALAGDIRNDVVVPRLARGGRVAAVGLVLAALALVAASASGFPLGWPTAAAGP